MSKAYLVSSDPEPFAFVEKIEVGDIVQIDPASVSGKIYGPQLVVVDKAQPWGIEGYFMFAERRGQPPGRTTLRMRYGDFKRVGRAAWIIEVPSAEQR
jgi:hypothetical protein